MRWIYPNKKKKNPFVVLKIVFTFERPVAKQDTVFFISFYSLQGLRPLFCFHKMLFIKGRNTGR